MTKKLFILFTLLVFVSLSIYAQDEDRWVAPVITDEMTVDSEQNEQWRLGEYKYSAKPKNAWELGVHLGHFVIDGDVDRKIPAGYGLGLHLRKAIYYAFSIRFDLFYGKAKGLDPQPWSHSSRGGGLVESTYSPYNGSTANASTWFPSHKTRYIYGAVQGVLNIGNILFHNDRNKWNWYTAIGFGFDNHKTMLDLLDSNGQPYTDLVSRSGFTAEKFDTRSGRSDIKSELNDIYDGDYETEGFKKKGIFRLGDETNIHFVFTASMGVSRKISQRFNIGLEHQVMISDNDYLDGIKFRTALDQTNNVDIGHYTNVRLAFNLGNFDKRTEPLYWLNPLDATFNDIAELKMRPVLDVGDDDGDGVINEFDQEAETVRGAPVDIRGIALDSDGDGFKDYEDSEPYSMTRYEIDNTGKAIIPVPEMLTEGDVINIINENCPGCKDKCGEWFLPMIHFDLDKYYIKPEFYGQLHHVATVMKQCPNICVVANGHTDVRNSNDYNNVLSYNRAKTAVDYLVTNYGIDRSRLKLMYGGEENPLIGGLPDHHNISKETETKQYMNRRVEFRLCTSGDYDMERPEGPDAGEGGSGSARAGSKYSGNKNSGY